MTIIFWLRWALALYTNFVAPNTRTSADEKIIAELTKALEEWQAVHGTEVSVMQLDQMEFKPRW